MKKDNAEWQSLWKKGGLQSDPERVTKKLEKLLSRLLAAVFS